MIFIFSSAVISYLWVDGIRKTVGLIHVWVYETCANKRKAGDKGIEVPNKVINVWVIVLRLKRERGQVRPG